MTWLNIFRINKRLNKGISHLIQTLPTVNTRGRHTKLNLHLCPPESVDETQPELVRYLKQKQTPGRSFHGGVFPLQLQWVFNNLRSQMRTHFTYPLIYLRECTVSIDVNKRIKSELLGVKSTLRARVIEI